MTSFWRNIPPGKCDPYGIKVLMPYIYTKMESHIYGNSNTGRLGPVGNRFIYVKLFYCLFLYIFSVSLEKGDSCLHIYLTKFKKGQLKIQMINQILLLTQDNPYPPIFCVISTISTRPSSPYLGQSLPDPLFHTQWNHFHGLLLCAQGKPPRPPLPPTLFLFSFCFLCWLYIIRSSHCWFP